MKWTLVLLGRLLSNLLFFLLPGTLLALIGRVMGPGASTPPASELVLDKSDTATLNGEVTLIRFEMFLHGDTISLGHLGAIRRYTTFRMRHTLVLKVLQLFGSNR